ncbi:hypothetical protein Ocin01_08211 [Orchesella cincta]|uniref:Uncharacterized protein n=1 Tax=Orchesella cincta TaxID=48709 RepID=A0A1D2MZQ1_ORCCI|nr:hypothetical protein Ocin01_08211 [Orchesella cincta]
MARSRQLILLLLGTVLFLTLAFETHGKSTFNRRKRQTEYDDYPGEDGEDVYEDNRDSDYERDARRVGGSQTFPPFPGYDEDYDRYFTEEPQTAPPLVVPTSSERIISNYTDEPETEEPVHKKVVPWLKRQWGLTKDFVRKHYDRISG